MNKIIEPHSHFPPSILCSLIVVIQKDLICHFVTGWGGERKQWQFILCHFLSLSVITGMSVMEGQLIEWTMHPQQWKVIMICWLYGFNVLLISITDTTLSSSLPSLRKSASFDHEKIDCIGCDAIWVHWSMECCSKFMPHYVVCLVFIIQHKVGTCWWKRVWYSCSEGIVFTLKLFEDTFLDG